MPTTLTRPSLDFKRQPKIRWYPEASGQSFKNGDWVYLVSGKLTIAAAASNDVGNISLLGRVEADATGVVDTQLPVNVSHDDSEYCFPMYHGTAGSAVTAVTDVGTTLPLRNQAGTWVVNKENDGTNDRIKINSIDPRYPVGERYGLVWGNVIAANRQAD